MRKFLPTLQAVAVVALIVSTPAWSKDVKVVTQDLMPIAGGGADGKADGGHTEVTKRVCAKLKWNCTFEVVPLARATQMIKGGEAHLLMGVAKNPEREEIAFFPPMVSQVGYTFFVKKGTASKFPNLESFKGKTVGVHRGSATQKDLDEQNAKLGNSIKTVEETLPDTSVRKLSAGRYGDDSAIYVIRPVALRQAQKENLEIEPVSFDAKLQSHTIALSKKSMTAAEVEEFNKALKEVMKSDEIKKYFAANNLLIHPDMR